MRARDWDQFRCGLPDRARDRLTAILESFAAAGEDDLPGSSFRWFSPGRDDPPGRHTGAFEALGVVLYGRRAAIGGHAAFFVERITIDEPDQRPLRRARKSDERQALLPLD